MPAAMSLDSDLFGGYWHLLCHRRELPLPGDFLRYDVPGGEVVVFNDAGDLVAFDNRCPHRGARIYLGDYGNQPATCGYHGWTFRQGRMIIPERESFKGCRIETATFNRLPIDWCGDFVFLGLAPRQTLYAQLGGVAELLENISFNITGRHDFNRYDFECYWPLAVENALEPYHISMVHPTTLGTLQLDEGTNVFDGINSVWSAPVGSEGTRKKLASLKRFFQIDYQYEGYLSIYLFPFTMLSSTFGYSYSLQHFLPHPTQPDRTAFTSRLLATPARSAATEAVVAHFLDSTAQVNRKVFEEDHDVCKRMPHEAWSMEPLRYASASEAKIAHFRDTCRQHAASQA
jgi:phenylpropionate dioxygenase-like ring-hydroxylating dioxygenase large terminal subunit